MSTLFEGLYLYEVVLLIFGVIFFVMLAIAFFYQLTHKASMTSLLPFFVLPIAMIAYPSVKSIQVKDGLVTIETNTQQLQNNPTDAALRKSLQQNLTKVADRPISNPQTTALIASAQYALGNEKEANTYLQKALQEDPKAPAAVALQKKITAIDSLKQANAQVEANPANSEAKAKLASALAETAQMKIANPEAITQVARAQSTLGNHAQALENAQKVVAITPNSPAALELQNNIKARMVASPATH